jgi:hypothetical protein
MLYLVIGSFTPGDTRWDSNLLMFESVICKIDRLDIALQMYARANPTLHPPSGFSQSLRADIHQIIRPLSLLRDTKQVQSRELGSIALILPLSLTIEKISDSCTSQPLAAVWSGVKI